MLEELRELYKYREILFMITYRDIKVRYKQSVMGLMWAVLMPILIVASGIVVATRMLWLLINPWKRQTLRVLLLSRFHGHFWFRVSGFPAIALPIIGRS